MDTKIEKMNEHDLQVMDKVAKTQKNDILICIILIIAGIAFFIYGWFAKISETYLLAFSLTAAGLLWLIVAIVQKVNLKKDLENQEKFVVRGNLQRKVVYIRKSSIKLYFYVDTKRFEAYPSFFPREKFDQMPKGPVQIELSRYRKVFLDINPV